VTLEYALNGADSRMYDTAPALVLNSNQPHYPTHNRIVRAKKDDSRLKGSIPELYYIPYTYSFASQVERLIGQHIYSYTVPTLKVKAHRSKSMQYGRCRLTYVLIQDTSGDV